MGDIKVKDKEIVVPGQILATGMDILPSGSSFREEDKIVASQIGIANISGKVIKVIPLAGKYLAKKGDIIIGKVIEMSFSNWFVDINSFCDAALSFRDVNTYVERDADLSKIYNYGDLILAYVNKVTRNKSVDLSMKGRSYSKLIQGFVITVTPSKVPRIIGKQGSMIDMIKTETGCKITVGQNGLVWIKGDNPKNELLASKAIKKINEESHIDGLTDKIKKFLQENKK